MDPEKFYRKKYPKVKDLSLMDKEIIGILAEYKESLTKSKADDYKYMCSECGTGYDYVYCGCPRCNKTQHDAKNALFKWREQKLASKKQ